MHVKKIQQQYESNINKQKKTFNKSMPQMT